MMVPDYANDLRDLSLLHGIYQRKKLGCQDCCNLHPLLRTGKVILYICLELWCQLENKPTEWMWSAKLYLMWSTKTTSWTSFQWQSKLTPLFVTLHSNPIDWIQRFPKNCWSNKKEIGTPNLLGTVPRSILASVLMLQWNFIRTHSFEYYCLPVIVSASLWLWNESREVRVNGSRKLKTEVSRPRGGGLTSQINKWCQPAQGGMTNTKSFPDLGSIKKLTTTHLYSMRDLMSNINLNEIFSLIWIAVSTTRHSFVWGNYLNLFPGVVLPKPDYGALETEINKTCE